MGLELDSKPSTSDVIDTFIQSHSYKLHRLDGLDLLD